MLEIRKELESIKEKGLFRNIKYLNQPQDTQTKIGNKDVLLLASNNYLSLANDERLKRAACAAIEDYGVGSGGSQLTTGSYAIHKQLEEKIAAFKDTEASIIYNTGYMANVGTIQAMADKNSIIFSDELNHASIIDGCRLSGAEVIVYKHCDSRDLENKLKKYSKPHSLIVTDGVFSMDGDLAPLDVISELAEKYACYLMVDDAHATGILGAQGTGTAEYFNIKDKVDIQLGTLSKSLGAEGGFVAGKQELIAYLKNKARSFIFSTSLSPVILAAALQAVEIVEAEPWRREILLENAAWFTDQLDKLGFIVKKNNPPTPIIPLLVGEASKAASFSKLLFEEGIFIPAIRPPSVPEGYSRLRISLMTNHTREQLQEALEKLNLLGKKLRVI